MNFKLPPRLYTRDRRVRRVGVEIEFGGVSLADATKILVERTRGRARSVHPHVAEVHTDHGVYRVEFDSSFFKKKKYAVYLETLGLGRGFETALRKLGELVIPFEIVTPPIPMTELDKVELIRADLYDLAATGATTSLIHAFGLQFNPEVPDERPETLLNYLRAFLLLYPRLKAECHIPVARQFAPYVQAFSGRFHDFFLRPGYHPDLDTLIVDYLRLNPTRNRPLDLLPLFKYLRPEIVAAYPVEHELVKARPTFHYRLPNSQVDNPRWSIAQEWNRWVEIEHLADNSERLQAALEVEQGLHA